MNGTKAPEKLPWKWVILCSDWSNFYGMYTYVSSLSFSPSFFPPFPFFLNPFSFSLLTLLSTSLSASLSIFSFISLFLCPSLFQSVCLYIWFSVFLLVYFCFSYIYKHFLQFKNLNLLSKATKNFNK